MLFYFNSLSLPVFHLTLQFYTGVMLVSSEITSALSQRKQDQNEIICALFVGGK